MHCWVKFSDGSEGYCEGVNEYDVKRISEHLTGKEALEIKVLPYPADPIIWQFCHPVYGKCPPFCYTPTECAGRTSCPKRRACSE